MEHLPSLYRFCESNGYYIFEMTYEITRLYRTHCELYMRNYWNRDKKLTWT